MEQAARNFARWVLAIHLIALLAIIVLVIFAAREIYTAARQQAMEQAQRRQELLALQTARGIEGYYRSILENLDLQQRAEQPTTTSTDRSSFARRFGLVESIVTPLLWDQLRGRASHLFIVSRPDLSIGRQFTDDAATSTPQIVAAAGGWLKTVSTSSISRPLTINSTMLNLVAVPLRGPGDRLLVAAVPLDRVRQLYLDEVNNQKLMSAWLIDQNGQVMIAFDPRLIGANLLSLPDQSVSALIRQHLSTGVGGTAVIDHPVKIGPLTLISAMTTLRPVQLPHTRWWLGIASGLKDVDAVVQRMFRRAVFWAIFLIVSITAILISTSVFMIRSRLRMERIRREILTKELEQARQIQLAWLPDAQSQPLPLDVAAVNVPASHISGDFYNWFELDDGRMVVLIGDVTGHGMAAAFLMATTQLLVRMAITNHGNAGACLAQVNDQLCAQGFHGQFVTMGVMVIEPDQSSIEIALAGHPAPLVSGPAGFSELKVEPQLVLGIEPDVQYESQRFSLAPFTNLLLYTDGATDALSPEGTRFNLDGLRTGLTRAYTRAQDLIDAVVRSVDRFRHGRPLADDLTLVAIQLEPVEAPQPAAIAQPAAT